MNRSSNIIIREASKDDIQTIRDLVYKIWPDAYGKILSPDQLKYMLDLFYSESSLQKQFDASHKILIVEEETQPVAFADYTLLKENIYKLNKIYVLPDKQGKSIGKLLINHIIQKIKNKNATALLLNVNRNNKAKQFYEHLGFSVIGEEDLDIGNGYFMNDFVMSMNV